LIMASSVEAADSHSHTLRPNLLREDKYMHLADTSINYRSSQANKTWFSYIKENVLGYSIKDSWSNLDHKADFFMNRLAAEKNHKANKRLRGPTITHD